MTQNAHGNDEGAFEIANGSSLKAAKKKIDEWRCVDGNLCILFLVWRYFKIDCRVALALII